MLLGASDVSHVEPAPRTITEPTPLVNDPMKDRPLCTNAPSSIVIDALPTLATVSSSGIVTRVPAPLNTADAAPVAFGANSADRVVNSAPSLTISVPSPW
jgi:hypothetical protein